MPRAATGQVDERATARGTSYGLRFRVNGQRRRLHLGHEPEWTRDRAERELRYVLAQVERGTWAQPDEAPAVEAPVRDDDPTFHVFASEWFAQHRHEIKPATIRAYGDELSLHLLPFFKDMRLSQITVEQVDRYKAGKLAEWRRWQQAAAAGRRPAGRAPIGAPTINKTLTRLGQVLEQAVEYGYLDRNPTRGRRRRLKVTTPPRSHLDRAEHFEALLAAAGALDAEARENCRHVGRRAMLATLTFAGLRLGELLELRWRDVDLAAGRIRVGERGDARPDAKTAAGIRVVDLLPVLRDELATWRAQVPGKPSGYVFATRTGGRWSESNVRNRVLDPAVKRANATLEADDRAPLPPRLTPHGLRHSFASLLVALGEDPRYVMAQLGHADPAFTLRLYTHSMRRDEGDLERLRALVGRDGVWATNGPREGFTAPDDPRRVRP